ncbi:MAG: SBBP repeat-containing protein, partial [Candidatus Helarchaeota archaeon]
MNKTSTNNLILEKESENNSYLPLVNENTNNPTNKTLTNVPIDQYSIFNTSLNDLSIEKNFTKEWDIPYAGMETLSDMAIDSLGNIYLVGYTSIIDKAIDMVLVKFDSSGIPRWIQFWGGENDDKAYAIGIDSLDNIYIVGYTESSIYVDNCKRVIAMIKYDSLGNEVDMVTWTPEGSESNSEHIAYDITISPIGFIYITGVARKKLSEYNPDLQYSGVMCILKYDLSLELISEIFWEGDFSGLDKFNVGRSISVDTYGNIYVTGFTKRMITSGSFGWSIAEPYRIFLIKYDYSHNKLWERLWSGNSDDKAYALKIAESIEAIFITGETKSYGSGSSDILLLKYDFTGTLRWYKTWGSSDYESGQGIAYDSLGHIFITGNNDNCLLEFNNNGDFNWRITSGVSGWEDATSIVVDSSAYIGVETIYIGGVANGNMCFIKYSKESNCYSWNENNLMPIWNSTIKSDFHESASGIAIDSSYNTYILGRLANPPTGPGFPPMDIFLAKFDPSGNLLWYRLWGKWGYVDLGFDIAVDSSDNVYFTGSYGRKWSGSRLLPGDMCLVKFDSLGNVLWNRTWGTETGNEFGVSLAIDSDDNIYLGGKSALVKYNSLGDLEWEELRGEIVNGITLDSFDNIIITTQNALAKYDSNGNKIWEKPVENHLEIVVDSIDNIYAVSGDLYNLFLKKYNINGDLEWIKSLDYYYTNFLPFGAYTYFYPEYAHCLAVDSSDNLYIALNKISIDASKMNIDIVLLEYDNLGNRIGWTIWDESNVNMPNSIALDSSGNVFIAGALSRMNIYGNEVVNMLALKLSRFISTPLRFSVKKNHSILESSKLLLSLTNFLNPYDNQYLKIIIYEGQSYELIPLPITNIPTNIKIEIPIYINKLPSKWVSDGCTYLGNLLIFTSQKNFDVDFVYLFLEDKYSSIGPMYYDNEYGYIDFGLDVSTYKGTPWKGSRVEVHIPKNQELKEFYNLNDDIYYDQLWSVNRVEFPYGNISYNLNLPYGIDYENHIFYINDPDIGMGNEITEALNPYTYRIYFNKKPLKMSLLIQKPNLELGHEIIQTNESDYEEYSLYCKVFDPDPISNITDVPYFINSTAYQPNIKYVIIESATNSYTLIGTTFENGINTEPFNYNLDAGQYVYISFLENVSESVYNTSIFVEHLLNFYEQPSLIISPLFEKPIMSDPGLPFSVQLFSPDGIELFKNIIIRAERSYWDAHDKKSSNLDIFANYSGKIYHFETGEPSSSKNLTDGQPFYNLLNNITYPDNSLIVAPEILEFNPFSNYSRQQIEIFIQLDLNDIIENFNLNPSKDFSFLNATIFGSSFIDSSQKTEDIMLSYGKLQIYNSLTEQYHTLLPDNIFYQTLEQGNPNNPLKLEDLNKYSQVFMNGSIGKYIDPQNKITFRLFSYFEGIISELNNTYLSTFDKPNAVLGYLLDYVNFDIVWWKNIPELFNDTQMEEITSGGEDYIYKTCPGIYNISFEFDEPYYIFVSKYREINVTRRPVKIDLEVPSEGYSTGKTILKANITDQIIGGPAIDAKVLFHSEYNGTDIILGESLTNINGIATLTLSNLFLGTYSIWAETIINNGRHVKPYKDEPFYGDKWAINNSNNYTLQMHLSQSSLELISLAPEKNEVIVDQNFYIYPKLIDMYTGNEITNELIDIYVNSTFIGSFYSANPFLINFSEPGQFIVEGVYHGTLILNKSQTSTLFNARRLSLSIIDISPM